MKIINLILIDIVLLFINLTKFTFTLLLINTIILVLILK